MDNILELIVWAMSMCKILLLSITIGMISDSISSLK